MKVIEGLRLIIAEVLRWVHMCTAANTYRDPGRAVSLIFRLITEPHAKRLSARRCSDTRQRKKAALPLPTGIADPILSRSEIWSVRGRQGPPDLRAGVLSVPPQRLPGVTLPANRALEASDD